MLLCEDFLSSHPDNERGCVVIKFYGAASFSYLCQYKFQLQPNDNSYASEIFFHT